MIEAYAFLVMFTMQVLVGSVLCPAWLIRRVRAQLARFPAERFAELFPGVDRNVAAEHFATRQRRLNAAIAVLGLLLLGGFFIYMRRPEGHEGPIGMLATVYLLVQMSPLFLFGWTASRYSKLLGRSLGARKRKAVLQRRGLFDFVSPFTVLLAVLSYLLVAVLVVYVRWHPFPGFGGFTNLGVVTLLYATNACAVYWWLYGKKRNPLETHANRLHAIGVAVKSALYTCIAVALFTSLTLALAVLHLKQWQPFALSVFFLICTFIAYLGVIVSPRQPEGDGLGSGGPLPPGTRDLSA